MTNINLIIQNIKQSKELKIEEKELDSTFLKFKNILIKKKKKLNLEECNFVEEFSLTINFNKHQVDVKQEDEEKLKLNKFKIKEDLVFTKENGNEEIKVIVNKIDFQTCKKGNHNYKKFRHYCFDCGEFICSNCITAHKNHDFASISDFSERISNFINNDLNNLENN